MSERDKTKQIFPTELDALRVEVARLRLELDERRRRRGDEFLRVVMDNTPVCLACLDRDFVFLAVNAAYAKQSGFAPEELTGHGYFQLFPDAETEALFRRARDGGEPIRFQTESLASPGQSERAARRSWSLVPVKDDDRTSVLVLSLQDAAEGAPDAPRGRDVPDEPAQRERRALADNSPDAVVRLDRRLTRLYANQALADIVGLPLSALVGKSLDEPRLPERSAFVRLMNEAVRGVFASGKETRIVYEYPSPDGPRHFETRIAPELDANGEVETVLTVARDVGAHKRLEAELTAAKEQAEAWAGELEAVFAAMAGGLVVLDARGRVVRANREALRILGLPGDERPFEEARRPRFPSALYPSGEPVEASPAVRALRGEETAGETLVFRDETGRDAWACVSAAPVRAGDGSCQGAVATLLDVTRERTRLAAILEDAPVDIAMVDAEGRMVFANKSSRAFWKETALWGDGLGDGARHVFLRPDGAPWPTRELPIVSSALDGLSHANVEIGALMASGETRTILVSTTPLRDEAGTLLGAVGVARDVTDLKRTQEALRRREEEFRALAENASDVIARLDRNLRRVYVNPAGVRLHGRDGSGLVGSSLAESNVAADGIHRLEEAMRRIFETGLEAELEYSVRGVGGDVNFQLRLTPEFAPDGSVESVLIVGRDITDLSRLTQALRAAKALAERRAGELEAAIEAIADGALIYDAEGRPTMVNAAARAMLGYDEADLRLPLAERARRYVVHVDGRLLAPEDLPPMRALRGATVRNEEQIVHRRDGATLWISSSAAPIRTADGRLLGAIVILANITRQKTIEAELTRAKEAAEAASRAKSEFLANMSHEIRTPMNGVLGMTELALMSDPSAETRDYLLMVRQSARSLLDIINDILDFSKIEAGRMELQRAPFELGGVLDSVVRPMGLVAQDKNLAFRVRVAPDVPRVLVGDHGRLRQILVNIVGNALKFTERGEVAMEIGLAGPEEGETTEQAARLLVSVRDTGVGVPADRLDAIFESFSQAGTSAHAKFGGTGLGLAICKQLAGMMGGRVWARSVVGQGSVFSFTVLFGRAGDDDAPREPERGPAIETRRPLRILLAEDNVINRLLAVTLLERRGHVVTTAGDGREALEALARERFDAVLMDVRMPGMDGLEAVRLIRSGRLNGVDPTMPVVALTAHAMAEERERFLAAGMDDHLAKPIDPAALEAVLDRIVDGDAFRARDAG